MQYPWSSYILQRSPIIKAHWHLHDMHTRCKYSIVSINILLEIYSKYRLDISGKSLKLEGLNHINFYFSKIWNDTWSHFITEITNCSDDKKAQGCDLSITIILHYDIISQYIYIILHCMSGVTWWHITWWHVIRYWNINTLRPTQNGPHIADNIFKWHFLQWKCMNFT